MRKSHAQVIAGGLVIIAAAIQMSIAGVLVAFNRADVGFTPGLIAIATAVLGWRLIVHGSCAPD